MAEERGVAFFDLPCRSLLNRCTNQNLPFRWSLNPYRGCELGCIYCYARYSHEFLGMVSWWDFQNKILVKTDAPRRLARELHRRVRPNEGIAIGTVTDPYQPAEKKYQITRQLLEIFLPCRGLKISITSKSTLVLRDLDLLRRIAEHNELSLNITLITLNRRLGRALEPRAPTPEKRLNLVRTLAREGLEVGVFVMPILPGLTDHPRNLEILIQRCAEAGARHLAAQVLFLRNPTRKGFLLWLKREFPNLVQRYESAYSRSAYYPEPYRERMALQVRHLKNKYGLVKVKSEARESSDGSLGANASPIPSRLASLWSGLWTRPRSSQASPTKSSSASFRPGLAIRGQLSAGSGTPPVSQSVAGAAQLTLLGIG